MNNAVSHPSHYLNASVMLEPIDITGRLNSTIGQSLQYVIRRERKFNTIEDLQKAEWYLQWFGDNIVKPFEGRGVIQPHDRAVSSVTCTVLIDHFLRKTQDRFAHDFMSALFLPGFVVSEESLHDSCELLSYEIERLKELEPAHYFHASIAEAFESREQEKTYANACRQLFALDPTAELRLSINGHTYFIHQSDMK